jgi:hypothetical protein
MHAHKQDKVYCVQRRSLQQLDRQQADGRPLACHRKVGARWGAMHAAQLLPLCECFGVLLMWDPKYVYGFESSMQCNCRNRLLLLSDLQVCMGSAGMHCPCVPQRGFNPCHPTADSTLQAHYHWWC